MVQTFRHIHISGTPYERGLSYGKQAKDLITLALDTYRPSFLERGHSWPDVIVQGQMFAARVESYSKDMLEEIKGIAAGSGHDLGEIVALNARTELLYSNNQAEQYKETGHQNISGEGCTGAIALPEATANGHVIHGQNWDWLNECAPFTIVLQIEQQAGPDVITLVEAGTLARCGLNSDGIAVTGNFLKTDEDFGANGIPAPFIRRKILTSANLHDAMNAVLTANRSFSINVMISDGNGEAIDFETTTKRVYWMRPENGLLVHSNHFLSAGAIANEVDQAIVVTPDSLYRDVRVRRELKNKLGRISVEDMKQAFADKYGAPFAVCRSPNTGPGGDSSATLATVVMDVTAGELHICACPYQNDEYQLFRF